MAYKNTKIIGDETDVDRLMKTYLVTNLFNAFLEIGEDKYCLPIAYTKCAEKIHNFEVRNDDTFVTGCQRTGTTWTREMVWLILNDLDYKEANNKISKRVPFLEKNAYLDINLYSIISNYPDMMTYVNQLKSPRCMITHLHWTLLPKEILDGTKCPKIIYVLRNPKDVCISYYHQTRLFYNFKGSFENFCTLFLEGRVPDGPFWKTVLSFWKQRHRPNILFIRYKDMIEDLNLVIKQVATFLGKQLGDDQIQVLAKHLNIESMRNNPAVTHDEEVETYRKAVNAAIPEKNDFIRNGKHNDYTTVMSPELIKRFDKWTEKHLEGTDLVVE